MKRNGLFYLYIISEQESKQKRLSAPNRIRALIFAEMRVNPSVATVQLMEKTGLKKTAGKLS